MGSLNKFHIILGTLVVLVGGLFLFLTVWDPPAPSEEVRKDVTDDLLTR